MSSNNDNVESHKPSPSRVNNNSMTPSRRTDRSMEASNDADSVSVNSHTSADPSGRSPETISDYLMQASRSTVLSWWNNNHDEGIECFAPCDEEVELTEEIAMAFADNSAQQGQSEGLNRVESRLTLESVGHNIRSRYARSSEGGLESIDEGSLSHSPKTITLHERDIKKLKRKSSEITSGTASASSSSNSCSTSSMQSSLDGEHDHDSYSSFSWKHKWASCVHRIGDIFAVSLTAIARIAALNPQICIFSMVILAFVLISAGLATNFTLVLDNAELWPPRQSFSTEQTNWLYDVSKFNYDYRNIDMIIHANQGNVLSIEGVTRVFDAMNVIQNMSDYQEGCKWADLVGDANRVGECHTHSVAEFWNNSRSVFESQATSDQDILDAVSATRYPSGQVVDLPRVAGKVTQIIDGTLVSAESFLIEFDLPWSYETEDFEWTALEALFDLQKQWKEEPGSPYRLEVLAYRSYEDEFFRAIVLDLPLLPVVFVFMSLFCCLIFWRPDKIHSRCLLGIGAVVTIMLSILTSHGLMFLCGVPFTTSTLMLPFLMFGVGLDDAFIIIGSYSRTRGEDIVKRIEQTMKDVSLSICITTLTSALAFALGCFSAIPSVRWLCLYACPSIIIDFLYQITFFIALIVLDERRIQARRMDCCVCNHVDDEEEIELDTDEEIAIEKEAPPKKEIEVPITDAHWSDRFMIWYAEKLLQPKMQILVILTFLALLAGSIVSATNLRQYFDLNDMVPHDSYLRTYYDALNTYAPSRTGLPSYAFFRGMNQSDPYVQEEMIKFVDDLTDSGAIAYHPTSFWLPDFLKYSNSTGMADNTNLTFSEQVEAFLQVPLYNKIYGDHIVRDEKTGEIIDSRCEIYIDVDVGDAKAGIEALEKVRAVSASQYLNEGLSGYDWQVFTYQDMYNLWEFYGAVLSELRFTTVMGVLAVSIIALVLVPHWSAVLFVAPLIVCLYIDMLGYINYTNVHINAISYVQIVMSIGLMVDFLMHILMRYYESKGTRRERVKDTLRTMGSSIFVGGLSSLLSVCLLMFSTSQILHYVFVSVLGLVVLGILHGLVFLPVILSLIGPQ